MWHLIVSEGGREYVLKSGSRDELEEMAQKLRAEKLFRHVRVDTSAPAGGRGHTPPGTGGAVQPPGDQGASSA
jgi:hypothetical protein